MISQSSSSCLLFSYSSKSLLPLFLFLFSQSSPFCFLTPQIPSLSLLIFSKFFILSFVFFPFKFPLFLSLFSQSLPSFLLFYFPSNSLYFPPYFLKVLRLRFRSPSQPHPSSFHTNVVLAKTGVRKIYPLFFYLLRF